MHVLEHIDDLPAAFEQMAALLKPSGRMIHICPNYALPYEPHIGRFYVPGQRPHDGVNYLTARTLRREGLRIGMTVRFDRGVMADYARRLLSDPVFLARQKRLRWAGRFAGLFNLVPPMWASPMVARFVRLAATDQYS